MAEVKSPSKRGTCSIQGCQSLAFLRGFCTPHYREHESPRKPDSTPSKIVRQGCSTSGCQSRAFLRGFCAPHYRVEVFSSPKQAAPEHSESDHSHHPKGEGAAPFTNGINTNIPETEVVEQSNPPTPQTPPPPQEMPFAVMATMAETPPSFQTSDSTVDGSSISLHSDEIEYLRTEKEKQMSTLSPTPLTESGDGKSPFSDGGDETFEDGDGVQHRRRRRKTTDGDLGKGDFQKYYSIHEKLGTGNFATVYRCTRLADGKDFAVKVIHKSKLDAKEISKLHDEVQIMSEVDHAHCVKMFEMFETRSKLFLVLELLTGGELFDRIVEAGSFSEQKASKVMKDVATAVAYIHSKGIVHRDLKPENLLYSNKNDDSEIKLTDFGLAHQGGTDEMNTACGTPGYVAPEVLNGESYTQAVDCWSLGVILYILLCGFPPFYSSSTPELYDQIREGRYSFPEPYWTDISDSAKDLVTSLLTVEVSQRMTVQQLLEHAWIRGTDVSDKSYDSSYILQLKLLQARRKFKRGVRFIMAIVKFSSVLGLLLQQQDKDPQPGGVDHQLHDIEETSETPQEETETETPQES